MVVGIAGGSASGKSTLCRMICESLPQLTTTLHHDDYYHDCSHLSMQDRAAVNFDSLESVDTDLFVSHLQDLRSFNTIQSPKYDYATHSRLTESRPVETAPIIIAEGIMILAEPRIRDELHLAIFVNLDDDLRFIRRLQRDTRERGRDVESVVEQYNAAVKRFHDHVIEPSKQHADIVIQTQQFDRIVNVIKGLINLNARG